MTEILEKPETLESIDDKEEVKETNKLILWNDDINSFFHVIKTLCEVLKIGSLHAEQIAVIVDSKKKHCIKSGTFFELEPYYNQLTDAGLTVEIQ